MSYTSVAHFCLKVRTTFLHQNAYHVFPEKCVPRFGSKVRTASEARCAFLPVLKNGTTVSLSYKNTKMSVTHNTKSPERKTQKFPFCDTRFWRKTWYAFSVKSEVRIFDQKRGTRFWTNIGYGCLRPSKIQGFFKGFF